MTKREPESPLTAAEIAELRRLDEEATPAPWMMDRAPLALTEAGRRLGLGGKPPVEETTIHTAWDHGQLGGPAPVVTAATTPFWEPGRFIFIRPKDAAVMVAARSALPRLLLSAERAEAAEGLAKALEEIARPVNKDGEPDAAGVPCWCELPYMIPYRGHDGQCEDAVAALAAWRSRGGGGPRALPGRTEASYDPRPHHLRGLRPVRAPRPGATTGEGLTKEKQMDELVKEWLNSYPGVWKLSELERREVFRIAKNLSSKEAAVEAGLSHETIRARRKAIYKKLGVSDSRAMMFDLLKFVAGRKCA